MPINKNKNVPDTLDLAGRAGIALNAMIGVADEDKGYIPFFSGFFASDPAWMSHGNWDYGSSHGRLVDSMTLVRAMTGTEEGREIENHYKENLLSFFRKDGLSYRYNNFSEEFVKSCDAEFEDSASMIDQRAVLLGLTTWFIDTEEEAIKHRADQHVAALKRIARKERTSWYYPASEYTEHGWPSFDAVVTRLCPDPCAMWGRQVNPLIRYHQITGNQDALELCENFVSNIVYRSGAFGEDGSWNAGLGYRNGHFHTRMGTIASLARYAEFTHDAFLMNWVKRCYDWGLSKCTSFGWTPGDLEDQGYEHETCTLVDAIGTAITLAKNGYPEYWGKAERFLRNQLTEAQLLDTSWIKQSDTKENDILQEKTYYKVADRLRGAFAGYSAPNDFVYSGLKGRGHIMDVQVCCVASGARGLYNGWNNIVTEERGRVSVNMLLNKASKWVDVYSYLPHEGKVELTAKTDMKELCIRIPEYVPYGAVTVKRSTGGEEKSINARQLPWVKNCFIKLQDVRQDEEIEVQFPVIMRKTIETAVDDVYETNWAGDNVISISPSGVYYPLYKDIKLLDKVPKRKVPLYMGSTKDFD
ncbi:hypothetical protein Ana3638_09755 [Anaerocolumna sedimenticola]|uniref:Uncharacterized protein n=1 Tax=Anaerocolumna sedimenticola TaxID=2696063 RepID=A0A6P1TL54_9FIRM|nr:hypothetical protein [Anaerocolumna sedimenticola]QHQ61017.1 hypothetical protein Ana3638_09755 [Anaerocolumna sedimenticola]